jgi:hypothetical protein
MGRIKELVMPEPELFPIPDGEEDTATDVVDSVLDRDGCPFCHHAPCDCDDQYDRWADR